MSYEAVIGIETHVELNTASKMFCACPVDFGAEPNTRICPVCLGLPGAMPVLNRRAVESAIALGLTLNCRIDENSLFHRKNYFYPDLPKNYQVSQYDRPLATDGYLETETDEGPIRVGITRVHMEEDTGKSLHASEEGRIHAASHTLLDFNRSGVPLLEVVSEPDLRSPEQAHAYATELRGILLALGISDAKLEEGSIRFDANVSIRQVESDQLGTKVEVKNMNSLRSLQRALAFEIERQTDLAEKGGGEVQETRHWNETEARTSSMRSKEEAFDYRYFPEPDLLPVEVPPAWVEEVASRLPELPSARRARYQELGLDRRAARLLLEGDGLANVFETGIAAGGGAKPIANWLIGEVTAYLRRQAKTLAETPLRGEHLAELDRMVAAGRLSATTAKEVLAGVLAGEGSPSELAETRMMVGDTSALEPVVREVLSANPEAVVKLAAGDPKLLGFLVGQVMKATGGKADPKTVSELIHAMTKETDVK